MSRRASVLLLVALTLLAQLAPLGDAHAQVGLARPAAPAPPTPPPPPTTTPPTTPPPTTTPPLTTTTPPPSVPSAAPSASPSASPSAAVARPPLSREQTKRLAAEIVAGRRAAKRAASYARRGKEKKARAEWHRAVLAYAAALELSGDAQLRLPLSAAEEGRGELVAAAHQLRFLLQAPGVRPEVTAVAAARLESLYRRLARVTFAVTPARAVVYRGIVVVADTPMSGPLLLAPGSYTFRFEANGFRSKEVTVELGAGEERRRAVDLFPLAPLMPPIERAAAQAAAPPPRVSRVVLAGAAATAALVVAAGATGGVALYRHGQLDDEELLARRRRLADSGERWALATDVLLGAAVLAAAGTAYYYFAVDAPRLERRRAAARAVRVVPWATTDSAGIGLAGAL